MRVSLATFDKLSVNTLGSCIGCLGAIPCCVVCPNPYKPVSQGNVGLVTKFGRFYRAVDPGLVKINPLSEKLIQVDVKIQIVGMLTCVLNGKRRTHFADNMLQRSQSKSA